MAKGSLETAGHFKNTSQLKSKAFLNSFLNVHTPADLLRFVGLYGPLTREGFYCETSEEDFRAPNEFYWSPDEGEELDLGLTNSDWFRKILREKDKPSRVAKSFEKMKLEKYQVEITPDHKHEIRFKFFPENLLDYLDSAAGARGAGAAGLFAMPEVWRILR